MDGGIEQPFAPTLRGLPIARVLLDIGNQPRVEDRFAVAPSGLPSFLVTGQIVSGGLHLVSWASLLVALASNLHLHHAVPHIASLHPSFRFSLVKRTH